MLPIRTSSAITAATRRITQLPYRRATIASWPTTTSRGLSSTARTFLPTKDAQDKDSLNPTSTEYSKSSGDNAAAHTPDAAFNPSKTSPQEEAATADRESGEVGSSDSSDTSPLDASPANPDISKPRDPTEGGAEKGARNERARTSGGGSPKKAGGGKSG